MAVESIRTMAKTPHGATGATARRLATALLVGAALAAVAPLSAQVSASSGSVGAAPATDAKPVIAAGTVPDEATRAAVLQRLRELYGADRVVDRIEVDAVVAPPNWREHVVGLLGQDLRQVSPGQLEISGNSVRISGQVGNEAQRQQVASALSTALNRTWSVNNALKVGESRQAVLDEALANRIIEFQSGSANLTTQGIAVLDEMARALKSLGNTRVQLVGHTDNVGARERNVALSLARAEACKRYLEAAGIAGANLSVQGLGPDRPVADNASADGRARNRRIEFKVL